MPLEWLTILECYINNMAFLLPAEIKLKTALTFSNYWMPYSYLLLWLLLRSRGILSLTLRKVKEITSLTFPQKIAALKGSKSQTSVMVQRNSPPNGSLVKLTRDTNNQHQKRKNNIGNQMVAGMIKRETCVWGQIKTQSHQKFFNSIFYSLLKLTYNKQCYISFKCIIQ